MNYPSLSLKQDLIDEVFYGAQKQLEQTPSPESIRIKKHFLAFRQRKYYKEQKESRLQNVVVEQCDQCEFQTTKFDALRVHKKVKHCGVKQKCTDCEYFHVYPNRVKMHYNQVHLGIKRERGPQQLKCRRESCEYAGTTNCFELQSHSLFFCEQCELSFERSDSLKWHNDRIHEGLVRRQTKIPRSCKEEGCTYIGHNLKQHVERKHEGIIVRLKCNVLNCDFETTWTKCLRRHAKVHFPEPLMLNKCNHCDYAPSEAGDLRRHLKTHSREKSNKCNQCDFASVQPGDLKGHLKTHSGEKSNKCNQCGYACSDPSALRAHLKTHTGEKPNKCSRCDYASSQARPFEKSFENPQGRKVKPMQSV